MSLSEGNDLLSTGNVSVAQDTYNQWPAELRARLEEGLARPAAQQPTWPDPEQGQQFHIDVTVDDLDAAEPQVLALGARKADVQYGEAEGWRTFLDPAGHPFCLCTD